MNIFNYTNVQMPEDCTFKISPSQISKFFNNPSLWYKEEVLREKEFKGTTSTLIGTICHAIYEHKANNTFIDRSMIEKHLNDYLYSTEFEDVRPKIEEIDVEEILKVYPLVANIVMSKYLNSNRPDKTEFPVVAKVMEGIYIGGTCDNLTGSVVVDYKTVASKPNELTIPVDYKRQLMTYAYALRATGKFIDRVRIVYGVKPLKTYWTGKQTESNCARCYEVTEPITYEDWQNIEDDLRLVALTVLKIREEPSLIPLLFKSLRLS